MAKIKRKPWSKKQRKEISERMKLLHAQRREMRAIAAGAGTEAPRLSRIADAARRSKPKPLFTTFQVDSDGIVTFMTPVGIGVEVRPHLTEGVMTYKIGNTLVSIKKDQ